MERSLSIQLSSLLALTLLTTVLAAPPLKAQCTCSVTVSSNQPNLVLGGTSVAAGPCNFLSRVEVFIDNDSQAFNECEGASCSVTKNTNSSCLRTGEHIAAATCRCGNASCDGGTDTKSETFSVNMTPTVTPSVTNLDPAGEATLKVGYSFPNTLGSNQRFLVALLDGSQIAQGSANDESNTWPVPLHTACWSQGLHELSARAVACSQPNDPAFRAESSTTVTINHTPDVSLSLEPFVPGFFFARVATISLKPTAPTIAA